MKFGLKAFVRELETVNKANNRWLWTPVNRVVENQRVIFARNLTTEKKKKIIIAFNSKLNELTLSSQNSMINAME